MIPLGILAAAGGAVAAAGSYDLLATEILTSGQSSITFASLGDYAADYQHLQIRATIRTNRSSYENSESSFRFNADTGTNYANHFLRGMGSSGLLAYGAASTSSISISDGTPASNTASNIFASVVIDILDAFNSSKYTTTRALYGNAASVYFGSGDIRISSGLWQNTDSITSITFMDRQSSTYVTDCRFSLYGIRKAA